MKNKTLLLFGGVILIVLLIFGTYSWYLYFKKYSTEHSSSTNTNTSVKVGDIEFKEDGNAVYDADAKSIEDVEVSKVPAYNFRVTNNGNTSKDYTLLIEDIPANFVNDGCSEDNLLSRKDLKYQLTLNDEVLKEDFLSNIIDNILDVRKIESEKTNTYSLKVYIHEDAKDWIGKHYHYKVVLKK